MVVDLLAKQCLPCTFLQASSIPDNIGHDRRVFLQSAAIASGVLLGGGIKAMALTEFEKVLIPVVQISNELTEIQSLVRDKSSWPKALAILQKSQYEKPNFKKTFNAVGDNLASATASGGGAPQNEQSVAYLVRNEVLTTVENLSAELEYLLKNEDELTDLYAYADSAASAMTRYLGLIPSFEVEQAQLALKKK